VKSNYDLVKKVNDRTAEAVGDKDLGVVRYLIFPIVGRAPRSAWLIRRNCGG
jgi:hypothetical protein